MDLFMSRKTTFWNLTGGRISVRPVRCSAEHEIEENENIIEAWGRWKVRATEFCYGDTIPNFHGILRIKYAGEADRNAAFITAHHVRVCAEILVRDTNNGQLIITGIPETIWNYIPFCPARKKINGRNELLIHEQINLDGNNGPAMAERELRRD